MKRKIICIVIISMFLLTGFMAVSVADVSTTKITNLSKTIYVDGDNTAGPWDGTQQHPYKNIQDGVDVADSGDTIFVYSGTYYENIVIDKSITLEGEYKNTVIIDGCNQEQDVICVTKDSVNIKEFTIKNGSSDGISIKSSNNCLIENNIIENIKADGVYLTDSCNNVINNIIINAVVWTGIHLSRNSNNNKITQNIIKNIEKKGIHLYYYSNDNLVENNEISDCIEYGIDIESSTHSTVTDNILSNTGGINLNGGELKYTNTHEINNNKVDGKPIYYYKNTADVTVPSGAGQIILANCNNFKIEKLSFENLNYAILIHHSSDITISENNFNNLRYYGIRLLNSNENKISKNEFIDTGCGIKLANSSLNKIVGNKIVGNQFRYTPDYGIVLTGSDNVLYENNFRNNYIGVLIKSSGNVLYHNNFIRNKEQAKVFGENRNVWNNNENEGNYWSDYYPNLYANYYINYYNIDFYPLKEEYGSKIRIRPIQPILDSSLLIRILNKYNFPILQRLLQAIKN